MYNALYSYLISGGKVYIEGVDVVGFDFGYYLPDVQGEQDADEVLLPLLGIMNAEDGQTNAINNLSGVSNTPTSGINFTGSTQTKLDYIDRFTALYPYARSAFEEVIMDVGSCQCRWLIMKRSFVFSYALSELTDGTFPNTRATS
jgi:hypothetical protein